MICLIEPWLRELGFGFFYGSVIIKLYRILAEFQTRKAHRVCVRDKDLLKYLFAIIFVIVGYLSAWTALLLDHNTVHGFNRDRQVSGKQVVSNIITESLTSDGFKFHVCRELSWYYVTEIGQSKCSGCSEHVLQKDIRQTSLCTTSFLCTHNCIIFLWLLFLFLFQAKFASFWPESTSRTA